MRPEKRFSILAVMVALMFSMTVTAKILKPWAVGVMLNTGRQ